MAKAYKDECPCKGCRERTPTCHAECEKYKAWVRSGIEEPRAFGIDPKRGKRKMNGGKKWNWNNY
jgi:hypothetical protein